MSDCNFDIESVARPAIEAVYAGRVEEVEKLMIAHPALATWRRSGTLLHRAATRDSIEMVDLLLRFGISVDAEEGDDDCGTPLLKAINVDKSEMVRYLLSRGANPNYKTCRFLIRAITGTKRNSLVIVKLLDASGADLNRVFRNDHTGHAMNALSTAIDWGKKDVEEYLRSRGCTLPDSATATAQSDVVDAEVITAPSKADIAHEYVFNYFKQHFGQPEKLSLIEIVPSGIPITIHCIPATRDRSVVTMFTTGMADVPMTVPAGMENYSRAELFIQLPADWKVRELGDPNWSWPQHWLRSMAQYPAHHQTWLGGPVTLVANDDPPRPIAPNCKFTTMLLMAERHLKLPDGAVIQFYRMFPLYTEERQLEIQQGLPALMNALDRASIPFIVDLNRRNVGLKA
jgi:hypothetical protein